MTKQEKEALDRYRQLVNVNVITAFSKDILDSFTALSEGLGRKEESDVLELLYWRNVVCRLLFENDMQALVYKQGNSRGYVFVHHASNSRYNEYEMLNDSYVWGVYRYSLPMVFPDIDTAQITAIERILR